MTKIATGAIKAALGEDDVDPSKVNNKDSAKEVLERVHCFCNCVLGLDTAEIVRVLVVFCTGRNFFQL